MDKGAKTSTVRERADFSTNGAGTTGYSQARELSWIPISQHVQKLTQKCQSWDFPGGPVVEKPPSRGFPGGSVVKNSHSNAGSRKILHAMEQLSPATLPPSYKPLRN